MSRVPAPSSRGYRSGGFSLIVVLLLLVVVTVLGVGAARLSLVNERAR
jgi:type IV pilus assembly protein PilX